MNDAFKMAKFKKPGVALIKFGEVDYPFYF